MTTRMARVGGVEKRTEIIHTTLLDLLQRIDEVTETEQEGMVTALRLLRGGRVRLVRNSQELGEGSVAPRARLRALIQETRRVLRVESRTGVASDRIA